jgi:hypothetical protein
MNQQSAMDAQLGRLAHHGVIVKMVHSGRGRLYSERVDKFPDGLPGPSLSLGIHPPLAVKVRPSREQFFTPDFHVDLMQEFQINIPQFCGSAMLSQPQIPHCSWLVCIQGGIIRTQAGSWISQINHAIPPP